MGASAVCLVLAAFSSDGRDYPFADRGPIACRDSLDIHADPHEDARECLQELGWEPGRFEARLERPDGHGDVLVRFPSPRPTGQEINDNVAVEWYLARDPRGNHVPAPAIVVVHEIGRNMAAGRAMAIGLSRVGLHAFLVQLPTYGKRAGLVRPRPAALIGPMKQAIADVRRARDVVVRLPTVRPAHVGLQGTSLGGIICATAGSLDSGFDSVHLLLAGGDLFDIIRHGQRDTAKVRRDFERAGVSEQQLLNLTRTIEPTRVAHRLPPGRTWLYSGTRDTVIPMKNAIALAAAANLDDAHHVKINADHYSGVVYLPWVVTTIAANVRRLAAEE